MELTVHGQRAYAYTGGRPFDPAQPTLVLVHGAMNDHSVFTLLARWFAHHGWSVLAPDLPGHRRSAGPALSSVEAMADWTWALLDAAGVRQAALAGHSMGSLVALQAAASRPERATALVMLGTCVPMPVPPALLDLSLADPAAAIERVTQFSFSGLAAKPSYPGPGHWLRGGARALMHQVREAHRRAGLGDGLFHNDFSACNGYTAGLDAAARVTCPAHLVLGRHDQMTLPRGAQAVAQALRAHVHTVEAGHQLMAEQPDAVLAALRSALAAATTIHANSAQPLNP